MILTRRALLGTPVLALLAGCASEPASPPQATPASPSTPGMTRGSPAPGSEVSGPPDPARQQAALEALKAMTTWHTDSDTTQTAADLRARPYFTEELAATITAPERNGAAGEWFAHPRSVSVPHVIALEGTDSILPGSLAYEVTWDWADATGHLTPGASVRLYNLAMTNTPAGWKISDYTYEEYPRQSEGTPTPGSTE